MGYLPEEVLPDSPMGLRSTSCGSNRERKVVIDAMVICYRLGQCDVQALD